MDKGTRILLTGASGFLGQRIRDRLQTVGYTNLLTPRSRECDFREQEQVRRYFAENCPEVVIHCAAVVGGIGANRDNPGSFFYENIMMGTLLMEEARRADVRKFVGLGTICCYPKFAPVPFREEDLWNGYPEETNAPYGLAKKMLLVQAQAYRSQFGFNAIYLMPVNLYGPGDNFNPNSSHVIPGLIKKCLEAIDEGRDEIVVWGDGSATREFMYVDDAARAIVLAAERYDRPEPVNVGSGAEISIKGLVELIAELTGFKGKIVWDASQPNGQPRRRLDTTKAEQFFGFKAEVEFREGLQRTIAWYREHVAALAGAKSAS